MVIHVLSMNIDSLGVRFIAPEKETAKDDAVTAGLNFYLGPVKGSLEPVLDGPPADGKNPPIVSNSYVGAARRGTPIDIAAQPWKPRRPRRPILSDRDDELWVKNTSRCKQFNWTKRMKLLEPDFPTRTVGALTQNRARASKGRP